MDYSVGLDRSLTFQLKIDGMDFFALDDKGVAGLDGDYDSELEFKFKDECGLLTVVEDSGSIFKFINEDFNRVVLSVDMKNQFARLPIYDIAFPKIIIDTLKILPDCSDLKIEDCKIVPGSFIEIYKHVNRVASENEETRNNAGEMWLPDIDLFVNRKYVLRFYLVEVLRREFSAETTINEKLSSLSLQRNDYVVFNTLP